MLGSSLPLFRIGETQVRLHPTFFLLLAFIGLMQGLDGGAPAALHAVAFVAILFGCVLAHEFGHILMARRFGIRTPEVTLWPFGGVAALERMPEKPLQEIAVALAGPAVNVAIVIVLAAVLGAMPDMSSIGTAPAAAGLVAQVAAANLVLAVFNMIPAFPMDGGRVLRAALALRLGLPRATRIAAIVGQAIAVALGLVGLQGNPMLVVVAVFVFLAASSEAGYVQTHEITRRHAVRDAMITRFQTLGPGATVDDAARLLLQTTQQEFPVVDGSGRMRGMVTRARIVAALAEDGGGALPVLEMMAQGIATMPASAPLDAAFAELNRGKAPGVGVVDDEGRLIGYVTLENIAELVMVRGARHA